MESTQLTLEWSKQETMGTKLFSMVPSRTWDFVPGQVAILGMEGARGSYFAIASPPSQRETIEFLIKKAGGISAALFSAPAGTQIWGNGPIGKGFPIEDYRGRDLLLVGVGTAIAPLRSIIKSLPLRRHDFAEVVVVYGVRAPEDFCFVSEMEAWRQANVEVIQVVSRPEGTNWQGHAGYVQSHLAAALKELTRPVALVCGMKEMIEQTRDKLTDLGVASQEVLTCLWVGTPNADLEERQSSLP